MLRNMIDYLFQRSMIVVGLDDNSNSYYKYSCSQDALENFQAHPDNELTQHALYSDNNSILKNLYIRVILLLTH
jgi:hypothetical protein